MSWKEYEFEMPLEVTFPEEAISAGEDWLRDCQLDDIFELDPACFPSKRHYDAALQLCRACGGWFYFESEQEKQLVCASLRAVIRSHWGEPMWYYDAQRHCFHWIEALREQNKHYQGKLYDIDSLWELFSRLQQRSWVEKAACFSWFVDFFGEMLVYDTRHELSNTYVNSYDSQLETILYFYPEQAALLTSGYTAVDHYHAAAVSSAAAGLIRAGKHTEGLQLYSAVFQMVWEGNSTTDERKNVVDSFLSRLAKGFENEPYLDDAVCSLLDTQCRKYSDRNWTAKIHQTLGRNKLS